MARGAAPRRASDFVPVRGPPGTPASHRRRRYSHVIGITDAWSHVADHSLLPTRDRSRRRVDLNTLRDNEGNRATAADRIALFLAELRMGRMLAGGASNDLKAALQILVPALVDEVGPINVEAELRAIVALTHQHWKHRLSIRVDIPEQTPAFWSRWWIARLAAMRMLMLAAETHRGMRHGLDAAQLPDV